MGVEWWCPFLSPDKSAAGVTIKHTEKMRTPAPDGKEFQVINLEVQKAHPR